MGSSGGSVGDGGYDDHPAPAARLKSLVETEGVNYASTNGDTQWPVSCAVTLDRVDLTHIDLNSCAAPP